MQIVHRVRPLFPFLLLRTVYSVQTQNERYTDTHTYIMYFFSHRVNFAFVHAKMWKITRKKRVFIYPTEDLLLLERKGMLRI